MIFSILLTLTVVFAAESFKLSPETVKSFGLKFAPLTPGPVEVATQTLVTIKDFKGVYLLNGEMVRRVPVKILSRKSGRLSIEIADHKDGDQIVIEGAGFVRGAELLLEEGPSHGHSH